MQQSLSFKLHSETQVSVCLTLGISGGKSPRHAQNLNNPPCPITSTFTSSVNQSSHQLTTTFLLYVLQCHLNDHLCRKLT